jgi:uncharacterized membrane protein
MTNAQHSVEIQRPLYEVFSYVADKENDIHWRSGVAEMKRVSDTKYRQLMKGPMGRKIPADIELTRVEQGKLIEFQTVAGPVRPHGRYDFVEEGGATRVTFTLDADLHGAKKLMSPMVSASMRSEVENLERLKRVLEHGSDPA